MQEQIERFRQRLIEMQQLAKADTDYDGHHAISKIQQEFNELFPITIPVTSEITNLTEFSEWVYINYHSLQICNLHNATNSEPLIWQYRDKQYTGFELYKICKEELKLYTCPNCGETTCTEECEFELERQRTTLKADSTPVTGETVEEAALIAYPVPVDGNTKHTILQINLRGAFINGAHWQKQQLNTPVTTTLKVNTVPDETIQKFLSNISTVCVKCGFIHSINADCIN